MDSSFASFLEAFDYTSPLSLYIHIPFCTSKCSYCAFYSRGGVSCEEKHAYVLNLVSRIDRLVSLMSGPFHTAFIGGGNPGCLTPEDLLLVCKSVCRKGRPAEFTTEMNPESLSESHMECFEYLNRLSMGVQSLDEKALSFLGRNSDLQSTLKGIELSKVFHEKTACRLSYDMITCLPAFHEPVADLSRLLSLSPVNHLSIYALTVEEGTVLSRSSLVKKLPNSDGQADILYKIWEFMRSEGFEHYEVSNFARSGEVSLHNTVYWDYGQYAGLGESAHSRAFKNGRATAFEVRNGVFLCEELTCEQAAEEMVIMGLRHKKGLDLDRLERNWGLSVAPEALPLGFENNVINGCRRLVPDDYGLMNADAAALQLLSR